MAHVETLPAARELLRRAGLVTARDFLALPGVILSGHPNRHVLRVRLNGVSFILKKEHRVPWRDRWASAWDGFGWSSKSAREARMLTQLREAGVPCPEVVAYGEDGRRAFVLLREETGLVDLRAFLAQPLSGAEQRALAATLGRELAYVHAAGFAQPDLYAKHVLLQRIARTHRFCFLDWQRSRRHTRLSWRRRLHDLAALDASLAEHLANDRLRLRCLRAYLRASAAPPPLARVAPALRRLTRKLLQRRKVRELRQPPLPADAQQLLWLQDDERLCIARSFHEELGGRLPDWLPQQPRPAEDRVERRAVPLPNGRTGLLVQRWGGVPSWFRRPDNPEFATATTIFRLQRFGVRGPRLLAMGRTRVAPGQCFSFVLTEPPDAVPLDESTSCRRATLEQAGRTLRQLHEAGYQLASAAAPDAWAVADDAVVLTSVEHLERSRLEPSQLARRDLPLLLPRATGMTRTDRLRFLRGYLGAGRFDQEARRLLAIFDEWIRQGAR